MSDEFTLHDNGTREQFGVGMAFREADPVKPACEGISPFALLRLGMHFTRGGVKYKDAPGGFRNWEAGMPVTRYVGAILRHTIFYLLRDTREDHAAAIMWNAQALMHHEAVGTNSGRSFAEIDDRPRWDVALGDAEKDWLAGVVARSVVGSS